MENLDLDSDSEQEEQDFVPSKKELESSEEEEEEEVESDDEVALKNRRLSSCGTPRSTRRSPAWRTPRRTPNKVKDEAFFLFRDI